MTETNPTPEKPKSQISVDAQEVNNIQADTVILERSTAGDINAKSVQVSQAGVNKVVGETVEIRQGGAQNVKGTTINVRQGGIVQAAAENLSLVQGGIVFAETQQADLTASNAGVVLSGGNVVLDQSITRAVLARGDVSIDQGGGGVIVGRNIKTGNNSGTILLLAGRVDGNVNAVFGPAASAAFGVAFALVITLILWLRRQLS